MADRTVVINTTGTYDYSSLTSAFAGEDKDLVANSRILTFDFRGFQDTAECTMGTGWNTSASYYPRILGYGTPSPSWDTGRGRLEVAVAGAYRTAIAIRANYTRFERMQVGLTGTAQYGDLGINVIDAQNVLIDSCFIRNLATGTSVDYIHGIGVQGGSATVTVRNTIIAGWNNLSSSCGITDLDYNVSSVTVENCTIVGCGYGVRARFSGTYAVKNTYAGGSTTSDYDGTITFTTSMSADSTSRTGVTASIAYSTTASSTSAGFTSVTAGSEDLSVKENGALIDRGTSLSGSFTTDIRQKTRYSKWGLGAAGYYGNKTVTVKSSAGSYSSLNSAFAGEMTSLVTAERILYVDCDNFVDTTPAATGYDWTTSSSYYPVIRPASGTENTSGVYGTTTFRMEPSSAAITLDIQGSYFRVQGIRLKSYGSTAYSVLRVDNSHGNTNANNWIDRVVVWAAASTDQYGIFLYACGGGNIVSNSVIYGASNTGQRGISCYYATGTNAILNNTVYGCYDGIWYDGGTAPDLKNNISYGNGGSDYYSLGSFGSGSTHNLSEDATAPAQGTYYRNKTLTFVDVASKNFNIDTDDADAIDMGTNLSATLGSIDLKGKTRYSKWTLGALQYYGPKTVTVKLSGGNYTSMSGALAGETTNLSVAERLLTIQPYASGSATGTASSLYFGADATWNPTASYYINVEVPEAEGHAGKWDDTKFKIDVSVSYDRVVNLNSSYARLTRVQVRQNNGTSGSGAIMVVGTGTLLDRCIFVGTTNASAGWADIPMYFGPTCVSSTARNSIAVSRSSALEACIVYYGATVSLDNCVFRASGFTYTVRGYGSTSLRNCYSFGSTAGDYYGVTLTNTCASADASGTAGLRNIAGSTSTGAKFADLTLGTEDFQIASDSALKGVGTDLSANFTVDIAGTTRTTPWDIGAFKAPSATYQYARPSTDVSNTGWTPSTGSDLFACVDEDVANDADYITGTDADATMTLATISTPEAGTLTLSVRGKVM